ncbi:MAG: alanyl-tRNA editing protein [Nitrososphaerota archaeon]|nr:alanyl-tRNA editing protein [Nitrososphaerota archaeon]
MVRLEQVVSGLPATKRLYLDDPYVRECEARVLRYVPETRSAGYLVLDRTVMHPKGGGQPSDTGTIVGEGAEFDVKKVLEADDVVVHYGKYTSGTGLRDEVKVNLDWGLRYSVMRHHTAGHIIDHAVLVSIGGESLTSASAFHGPPESYIEFEGALRGIDLRFLEEVANSVVREDRPVKPIYVDPLRLREVVRGAFNLNRLPKAERYRVVVIEGINAIPCGGTHVSRTSEVGTIRVTGVQPSPAGFKVLYRVET